MADAEKVKPLSKTQIATHLADKLEVPKKLAAEFLDELAALAYAQTSTTGEFTVPGIGKLIKQERAARDGRNPSTGEAMRIEAKTVVKFRIAKAAKDAVLPRAEKP